MVNYSVHLGAGACVEDVRGKGLSKSVLNKLWRHEKKKEPELIWTEVDVDANGM